MLTASLVSVVDISSLLTALGWEQTILHCHHRYTLGFSLRESVSVYGEFTGMNLQLLNVSQHPVFDVWRARVLRYSSQAYCVCRILFEMNCSVHFSGEEVLIILT